MLKRASVARLTANEGRERRLALRRCTSALLIVWDRGGACWSELPSNTRGQKIPHQSNEPAKQIGPKQIVFCEARRSAQRIARRYAQTSAAESAQNSHRFEFLQKLSTFPVPILLSSRSAHSVDIFLTPNDAVCQHPAASATMAQQAPPRVSFSDKDLENGAPNNDRAASRKWSTAPGNIEDLDEYTALQKYISTYRDPKAAAADDAEGQQKDAADAGKGKAWWQFWRSGTSSNAKGSDPGVVPEELLEADIKQGISNHDVESRRKRFGWNEITTEKENLFIKFLSFFTGPILYGMSALRPLSLAHHAIPMGKLVELSQALLHAKQLPARSRLAPDAKKHFLRS